MTLGFGLFNWVLWGGLYLFSTLEKNYSSYQIWMGFALYSVLAFFAEIISRKVAKSYINVPSQAALVNRENIDMVATYLFYGIAGIFTAKILPVLISYNII